ncbi:MAG: hypothetical protein R2795_06440 [Saprospiraceae bacterium]
MRGTIKVMRLLCHGNKEWKVHDFDNFFNLPDAEQTQYIPLFRYELVDLSQNTKAM